MILFRNHPALNTSLFYKPIASPFLNRLLLNSASGVNSIACWENYDMDKYFDNTYFVDKMYFKFEEYRYIMGCRF